MTAVTVVTVVRKLTQPLHKKIMQHFFLLVSFFGKCNLTHLTTNVMFSGQRFAILAMFRKKIKIRVFTMRFGTQY